MLQKQHILVADDDPGILRSIQPSLEASSYKVSVAKDGSEAIALFEQMDFCLIILDIKMPKKDGIEVCRYIRESSIIPIIILTADGEESQKITALNLGADDYLTKPFGIKELLARVKAVIRRSRWMDMPVSPGTKRFGNLEIDFEQRCVRRDGEYVKLTPTEFKLLRELALHPGKIRTHRELLQAVWNETYSNENWFLRVFINRLRRKLEDDPSHPVHILTKPGVGYYMAR